MSDYQAAMAESRTVTDLLTASQREIARLNAELAIERERNSHRVICPKCQASLPCESCQRYQADVDAALALLRRAQVELAGYRVTQAFGFNHALLTEIDALLN